MQTREGMSRPEKAAATAKTRLRSGWARVRGGWLQILQTALAAAIAWFLAALLLGIDRPTFAPIGGELRFVSPAAI